MRQGDQSFFASSIGSLAIFVVIVRASSSVGVKIK
jgi:hypothetical protein